VIEEGLNGRTTMWDDPFVEWRNGREALPMLLESHSPLDVLILMLGTNDLKLRFDKDPFTIAEGMGSLVRLSQNSSFRPKQILVVSPPPLSDTAHPWNSRTFAGTMTTSKKLAEQYEVIANALGCHFFDSGSIVSANGEDGVHLDRQGHQRLAEALIPIVNSILDRSEEVV
jgi:lysophospholipase L1-like esterase